MKALKPLIVLFLSGCVNSSTLGAQLCDNGVDGFNEGAYLSEETAGSQTQWPASMVSGTVPVMMINTENGQPIVDKENKIPANLWIEIPENCPDKEFALGSEEEPVELTIKGRGNSTWLKDKKPYKLKFEKKTEILGMPKHKHFALLAGAGGWDYMVSQVLGMELARQVGMDWASRCYPTELVLNGEYLGLYYLFESVKIDKNRVDIFEQEDLEEDDEIIPYGWLVEVDNYDEENQIRIYKDGCTPLKVTYHSPENLSEKQEAWLKDSFLEINDVINSESQTMRENWGDYIDPVSMAQYFIVREIMHDYDGFNGSTYMHRDKAENAKWVMGPMWDTRFYSWPLQNDKDWTKNELPEWSTWKILPEIFNTKCFNDAFLDVWNGFYPEKLDNIEQFLLSVSRQCMKADMADVERWPRANGPISDEEVMLMMEGLRERAKWIDQHKEFYYEEPGFVDMINENGAVKSSVLYDLFGVPVETPTRGIYIKVDTMNDGRKRVDKVVNK